MASIHLDRVTKVFPDARLQATALDALSLNINSGELFVLLGPSGSGKTTTLRLIAGLDKPSSGRIICDGIDITDFPPADRGVAMVFQSPTLFPHLNVADNVGFALRMQNRPRAVINETVVETLRLLGMEPLAKRFPSELSGGEQQRVALGRAIAQKPRILLLDEPLSSLDAPTRSRLRAEIKVVQKKLRQTVVYVTHDRSEALALADRVAILRQGQVEQVGEPIELHSRPATLFTAQFMGTPETNLLRGHIQGADGDAAFHVADTPLRFAVGNRSTSGVIPAIAAVRTEDVSVSSQRPTEDALEGVIETVEFLGWEQRATVRIGSLALATRTAGALPLQAGDRVWISIKELNFYSASAGQRIDP